MFMTLALLLAQVGPYTAPGIGPAVPQRPAVEGRDAPRRPARTTAPAPPQPPSRLKACLDDAEASPTDAIDDAEQWLTTVKGTPQVEPNWCLGAAHSRRGEWGEAEAAYLAARDAAAPSDFARRAQLGGMGGNAALAGKAWDRALAALDVAQADAAKTGDARLSGEIAIDRARALVALKRDAEAATALVEARTSEAKNPLAWLLSATLSRRQGKLAEAQAQIATAASLAPTDPEVGLEAGVIAVLAGHDEAARKSWQSVIAAAPTSEAATTARSYLAQLGGPASKAP
jgi:tetratricopeptide (TPR) repeat protein